MFARKASTVLVAALVVATFTGVAFAKASTKACGSDRCRTIQHALDVATVPGAVPAPRSGRYYTISLRVGSGGDGWTIVYEADRRLVRASDAGARSFLGSRWARLARRLWPEYATAVRGLRPMLKAPASR
jgi:hypothetical protein